ncbi:MAG: hypothetical protein WC965_06915 [Thiohalomonadaceae bacterium]|jgi:hypothetical protein
MARIGLKARLAKLENRRVKQGPNRVLCFNPAVCADGQLSRDLSVWQVGYWREGGNPAAGPLRAFAGRFVLIPDHGTTAEWEAAAEQQQRELLARARSRTDEPAAVVPDIVGTIADDAPAPKRQGEKGVRFVELQDGRTFDKATGEFVE